MNNSNNFVAVLTNSARHSQDSFDVKLAEPLKMSSWMVLMLSDWRSEVRMLVVCLVVNLLNLRLRSWRHCCLLMN